MTKPLQRCTCGRHGFLQALGFKGNGFFGFGASRVVAAPGADELRLPDTAACKAAEAYLGALSSSAMVGHCKRTFLFGRALADKAGARPDLEALYVGSLFHDLGLEPIFEGPDDFEVIGAREASRFLKAKGYPVLADTVAAAIEIHTSRATAEDPRPEVAYLNMGATVDVLGLRIDQIDRKLIQQIVEEYPRDGTKTMLTALLKREIDTKPNSNFSQIAARVDVLKLINDAPFAH
ncbi:HD domain-containing protein [Afipia massiliensis]|nr:HD domain-containing protein [Afipia massiliensis]